MFCSLVYIKLFETRASTILFLYMYKKQVQNYYTRSVLQG